MVKELISYRDETFELLFNDIAGFSSNLSNQIFEQEDRRIAIYGVRGLGKTTAMQGALWLGFKKHTERPFIPLNVIVSNAHGAQTSDAIADLFYRAVILSVVRASKEIAIKEEFIQAAKRYAPWVAKRITELAGVVFPPIATAASLANKSLVALTEQSGNKNIDSILSSANLNAQQVATILLDKLAEEGGEPVFVIDELDKVDNDAALADFFDANQAWFQGKRGMISLSYTFGEAMRDTTITSVKRIAKVETIGGITTLRDATDLIRTRASLGLSQLSGSESETVRVVEKLIPEETIVSLVNLATPITFLMLERMSSGIDAAIKQKATRVLPEHLEISLGEERRPTKIELSILEAISPGRLHPSVISEKLDKDPAQISRALKKMAEKSWVSKLGSGKQVLYCITTSGESARRRGRS